jgi:hypothetical protein
MFSILPVLNIFGSTLIVRPVLTLISDLLLHDLQWNVIDAKQIHISTSPKLPLRMGCWRKLDPRQRSHIG